LAAGRRVAGRFLARAGVVAAIVVFLLTVRFAFQRLATYASALVLYNNMTGMDNVLDEWRAKCINGLSNDLETKPALDHHAGRLGQTAWSTAGSKTGAAINKNGGGDEVVGGKMLQQRRGKAAV
jgi:hypothetical protein